MSTYEQFLATKNIGSAIGATAPAVVIAGKDNSGNAVPLKFDGSGNLLTAGSGGGDASAANQVTGNGSLASILAKISADPATQTTLAAVLAKLSADPATQTTLAAILAKLTNDPATQTTTAAILAKLSSDPATQTTLAAVLAGVLAATPAGENFVGGVGGRATVAVATMAGASGSGAAYTAGDLFGNSASANNAANMFTLAAARAADKTFVATRIRAKINDSAFATKRVRFWFFKNSPATVLPADNGALGAGANFNESTQIGTITITFGSVASADGYVKGFGYPDDTAGVVWTCEPASATANIFAIAELLDAVTATASGKVMTLAVEVAGQN